ncbi:hypothetical protein Aple_056820 [Acrocarpospora pleiomorpha]|uniref:Uncharacterized protein n=1 Tax=Acrocarpospora pleiomorpha TaxID=90975 RepID=A0A5M3XU28_9ACTN|nr:hypothetical protein [Acrocarpospora pleiomorpha]GES22783.1 hypothetical protein Aple_056820 [Acrocarpospora pleiomorpha]
MDPDLASRILHRVRFGVRLLLLLLLLCGALVTSASYMPSPRTVEQFRSAVAAGEVDRVSYQEFGADELAALVWSESPLVWHEVQGSIADSEGPYTTERLRADMRRASVRPSLMEERGGGPVVNNSIFPDWPFGFRGGSNLWWIAAVWVVTFVAMLFSTPRLANRWAWFWMFTVGQIGAFLFLITEPRPLWKGPGEGLAPTNRIEGSRGCLYSIALSFVSLAAVLGAGQLIKLVLG